ncbi:MAG: exodeoxyribonuclease VII large subunit [bacterium]
MPTQVKIYSISQITSRIRNNLESEFGDVWIEGEISNLKAPFSGHIYFILKDSASQIRAVAFRYQCRSFTFRPQDGMKVLVRGRITVYDARGEYQIVVERMEVRGAGALQAAFEQLKAKLQAEGLFAPEAKKPIPLYPQTIGIVTSPTGAAIRDILQVIRRRFSTVSIVIYPVRVQGEEAPGEIARAVREFNEWPDIDVLIVGRGGGSIEDLWAFNEEVVARAIFESRIPIISAVGHEIDFTIADFVADLRAPTPSAAAELVVKNKKDLLDRIEAVQKKMHRILRHKVDLYTSRVQRYSQTLVSPRSLDRFFQGHQQTVDTLELRLRKSLGHKLSLARGQAQHTMDTFYRFTPLARIRAWQERVGLLGQELYRRQEKYLENRKARLCTAAAKLDSLSPLAVLKRGYGICRKLPDLTIITDSKSLGPRDLVNIKLFCGEIICEVKNNGEI